MLHSGSAVYLLPQVLAKRNHGERGTAISVRVQPDLRALPDVQSRGRDSGGLSTLLHRRY